MSLVRFYGYQDKVVIPTVVQAEEGFYLDSEPVTVCDTTDEQAVRAALSEALACGNQEVPTPTRDDARDSRSPILEALSLKRWLKFEAEAVMYSLHKHEDRIDYYSSGNAVNGSWTASRARHICFEQATELKRVIDTILGELASDYQARSQRRVGGLMLLAPPAEPAPEA